MHKKKINSKIILIFISKDTLIYPSHNTLLALLDDKISHFLFSRNLLSSSNAKNLKISAKYLGHVKTNKLNFPLNMSPFWNTSWPSYMKQHRTMSSDNKERGNGESSRVGQIRGDMTLLRSTAISHCDADGNGKYQRIL